MASDTYDYDAQDQSEVFDEDNLDESGEGREFKTFEEYPDVFDVTRRAGDENEDEEALDEDEFDPDAIGDEDLEEEDEVIDDDVYDETDEEDVLDEDQVDGIESSPRDEIPLEYQPDVDGRRGAQGSAGHFESRGELSLDEVRSLGYADEGEAG